MEYKKFQKIPRLSRDCLITEKIDGTNANIFILSYETLLDWQYPGDESYSNILLPETREFIENYCLYRTDNEFMFAGSKARWLNLTKQGDNFGFARWVEENAVELMKLGVGRHSGEWMGKGIQCNYGLEEKRFYLFNAMKWSIDPSLKPKCCKVVPILYKGMFHSVTVDTILTKLRINGSYAVPGWKTPEGLVVFHTASRTMYKKTLENDSKPKGTS